MNKSWDAATVKNAYLDEAGNLIFNKKKEKFNFM